VRRALVLLAALAGCAGHFPRVIRDGTCFAGAPDPEEVQVYVAVLNSPDLRAPLPVSTFVAAGTPREPVTNYDAFPSNVARETIDEWIIRDRRPACLGALPTPSQDGWRMFPRDVGTAQFSRVGFNAERSEALVYLSEEASCGCDRFVVLRRYRGGWRAEPPVDGPVVCH
jgi:hypothetical protein